MNLQKSMATAVLNVATVIDAMKIVMLNTKAEERTAHIARVKDGYQSLMLRVRRQVFKIEFNVDGFTFGLLFAN